MSLMAVSAQRSSVFTFESSVHSCHVLRCLDEQRRRDVLCDVTVVVEGQSFRAHRSVLASCSEYFSQRISSLTQQGAVVTLPPEVTAAGFEPLLKFAYTSKLLFRKDDVLEIRNSASVLGFRDLDEACFDFLLPKFFSSSKISVPFLRKTCCKKKCKRQFEKNDITSDDVLLDEKEVKPVADSSSQQEVAFFCKKSLSSKTGSQTGVTTITPVEGANDTFTQCPKYRKFQLACGKETCFPEKSVNNTTATVTRHECDPPCSVYNSLNCKNETEQANSSRQKRDDDDEDGESKDTMEREGKWDKKEKETESSDLKMEEEMEHIRSNVTAAGHSSALGQRSPGLILHHCSVRASAEGPAITGSLEQQENDMMDFKDDKTPTNSGINNVLEERIKEQTASLSRERSNVEQEASDHLPKPPPPSDGGLNLQDPDAGSSSDSGSQGQTQTSSLDWEKLHVNLSATASSSSSGNCPFLQDLDQSKWLWRTAGLSESEGASYSGVSSLTSGEDGDSETETEGDSESYTRERAREVQLPYDVDRIVDLSRNDFQQLLKQQVFTREQLEFVHDMRRRSKNRLAAQRCRKRKLDCIYNLQCEINKLKTEREKLLLEKSQLSQLKLKTCHSVSSLCQRVCNEANLQPEQLHVLAKYTSPDCPLASLFPHIDALLSHPRLLTSPPGRSVGRDENTASEEASSGSSSHRDTGDVHNPL